jgi:hypothetical protein
MNTRHNAAVTVLLAAAVVPVANANTIYVDVNAFCFSGNGSILNPYCLIQTAIANAVHTDEIIVAPGVYHEAIDFLGKSITVRVGVFS